MNAVILYLSNDAVPVDGVGALAQVGEPLVLGVVRRRRRYVRHLVVLHRVDRHGERGKKGAQLGLWRGRVQVAKASGPAKKG